MPPNPLTPAGLRELVTGARAGCRSSLERLCLAFRPLILKESRRESVYRALGEDATSIAWTVFLTFIRRYNGCDYVHLPGLIRCYLRYELLHAMQRRGKILKREELCAAAPEHGAACTGLARLVQRLALRQAMARLPERQRAIIHKRFFEGALLKILGQYLRCSQANVLRLQKLALEQLRAELCDEVQAPGADAEEKK